ncbi:MAG: hypothetical protein A2W25_00505 [candidate division Zixibacteria bacterium RBG_16_53_22]|nr:MAG: hypothetical protein A2W25_00505 [candidate division Zixibacteria bacterium RBG_16_53_22]
MKRLILPTFIIGIIVVMASGALAQIPIPNDTMKVVDNFGHPGDTVNVFIYFKNDIALNGYSMRIAFNRSLLEAIDATCVDRGCNLEATQGQVHQDSAFVVLAVTWFNNSLPTGRGNVLRVRFRVNPQAPNGNTTIRFSNYNTEFVNLWTDNSPTPVNYLPSLVDGNFTVTTGVINSPPVIGSIGPQQVAEGQLLQFMVQAYDLDGDPVTLSAEGLPANSGFPTAQGDSTVSGAFTFSPTYEQGPDTFFVDFVATDDHNNTTRLTVRIIVLDQPNDRLIVNSGQGGVPGASGRDVNVDLSNSHPVYGIQFNYHYDEAQIEVTDVVATERCLGLGFWYSVPEPGEIIVLIFSPGLDPIEQGSGPIVRVLTNVRGTALFGRTPVVLDSAVEVIDSIGTSRRLVTEDGYFTVDRFGDANLDENVNVGDCITVVAFIIERIELSIRQFDAADINRDGRVNVVDLQNVIDRILMIPLSPGPVEPGGRAIVELSNEVSRVGDLVTIDLMADITTEAAALQYRLAFNPERLEPLRVESGEMVSGFTFENEIGDGSISGIVYNLTNQDGATFGPAQGSLSSFTFRLKTGDFSPADLAVTDFAITSLGAALIPSEIRSLLPTEYVLSQNYPNPFNASTTISFDLPADGDVELSVYDIMGRLVATLVNGPLSAGSHQVVWNGRSDRGDKISTGVFFYRLRSSEFDETKKMLLIK